MGLDVYAGTLTRYYSNNWKTIVQQIAEERGWGFQTVDEDGNVLDQGSDMSEEEIKESVGNWRDQVCGTLATDGLLVSPWAEDNSKPYYTDKPDWDAFGALVICASCVALKQDIPQFVEKDVDFFKHPMVKKALSEESLKGSLMTGVTWWLPIEETFSFRFPAPTEGSIRVGTAGFLLEELKSLNDALWQATEDEIIGWSGSEGYPETCTIDEEGNMETVAEYQEYDTQSLAKFALSVLWQAAKFALKEGVPMLLDPWEAMNERLHSALYGLQTEAIVINQDDGREKEALNILHGLEKYLSKRESVFYGQCTYYVLASIYNQLDDYEKAFSYAQLSIDAEAYGGDAYTLMGIMHKNQEDYVQSVEAYKNAILAKYLNGGAVMFQFEDADVWNYMSISMMYAQEEDKSYDITRILRVLYQIIVIDPEYYNAYNNISICFKELVGRGLIKALSKEHMLSRSFLKVYKEQRVSEEEYRRLLDKLVDYTRDDDYPYLKFAIYLGGERAPMEVVPTFNQISDFLGKLWNRFDGQGKIELKDAFGKEENSLSISVKEESDTQKQYFEYKAVWSEKSDDSLFKRVDSLEEGLGILERYFYYHELKDASQWLSHKEYSKETLEQIQEAVVQPFAQRTGVPYNEITLKKESCTNFDSKVGGDPYMPEGFPWPCTEKGTPLRLLAQINFEQMPVLENFPRKGILQFFILENDVEESGAIFGLDFENPKKQASFRVIYHETVDENSKQQIPPESCFDSGEGLLNKDEYMKMLYRQDAMPMTVCDYRFEKEFLSLYNEAFDQDVDNVWDLDELVGESIYDEFWISGHRIWGYPSFTQTDPRDEENDGDKNILLLQLDSDDVEDICFMWGDAGVGNFFISKEDLRNRRFTDVLYNWDCG